jgi:hypothetical protein
VLGEQVDDLSLAFVSPLGADNYGRWHRFSFSALVKTDARAKPAHPLRRRPSSGRLGAPTITVVGTSKKSARKVGYWGMFTK